jgi:hypothetical protein
MSSSDKTKSTITSSTQETAKLREGINLYFGKLNKNVSMCLFLLDINLGDKITETKLHEDCINITAIPSSSTVLNRFKTWIDSKQNDNIVSTLSNFKPSLSSHKTIDLLSSTLISASNKSNNQQSQAALSTLTNVNNKLNCKMCLVQNTNDKEKCVCCDTPRDNGAGKKPIETTPSSITSTQPSLAMLFGNNNKWNCKTCLAQNNSDQEKCACCDTPKDCGGLKTSVTVSLPKTPQIIVTDAFQISKAPFTLSATTTSTDGSKWLFDASTITSSDSKLKYGEPRSTSTPAFAQITPTFTFGEPALTSTPQFTKIQLTTINGTRIVG